MRWALCLLVVLASCKSQEKRTPPEQSGSATAPAEQTDAWKRIEGLATPPTTTGPSAELERALPLVQKNQDVWRELRFKRPAPTLADYPDGATAIAAAKAWVAAKGGLPALRAPSEAGIATMQLHTLGSMLAATATSRDDLAPAVYLGTLLITHGRNMLEVQVGAGILSDASHSLRMLAGFDGPPPDPLPAPNIDLVRILAAEALHSRKMLDWSLTAAGKRAIGSAMEAIGSDSKALAEELMGRNLESMVPSEGEVAAYKAFWLSALEGAQRGEAAAITIERVRKAAENAPSSIKDMIAPVPRMAESLVDSLERVKNPPY